MSRNARVATAGAVSSGVDEGHEDVASSTGRLQALVEVREASREDQRPANTGVHEGAVVTRVMHATSLKSIICAEFFGQVVFSCVSISISSY